MGLQVRDVDRLHTARKNNQKIFFNSENFKKLKMKLNEEYGVEEK